MSPYSFFVFFSFDSHNSCITLKQRGIICGPVSDGYESRTIPNDLKDEHENRRNQQVYSASPVKTVDKHNDPGESSISNNFLHSLLLSI